MSCLCVQACLTSSFSFRCNREKLRSQIIRHTGRHLWLVIKTEAEGAAVAVAAAETSMCCEACEERGLSVVG